MRVFVGISDDKLKISASLFDSYGKRLEHFTVEKRERAKDEIEREFSYEMDKLTSSDIYQLQAIGLGIDGTVSLGGSLKFTSKNKFYNYPLAVKLREKYDCGVVVNNNANCSAYGIYKYSRAIETDVVSIFAGETVGGSLILDGKIYFGKLGPTEIAHTTVEPEGVLCNCGNYGCLEAYTSREAIQKYIAMQYKKGRDCLIGDIALREHPINFKQISAAYNRGDDVVREAVNRAFKYLAIQYSNLSYICRPELVIFGGELFESLGSDSMEMIKMNVKKYTLLSGVVNTRMMLSELGQFSSVYGAYRLSLDADIGVV